MKIKIRLSLLLFFIAYNINAQSYLPYYRLCNDGDRNRYKKNYSDALDCYEKAFSLVPYVHLDYLIKAISCASKLNRQDLAIRYTSQYYLQSGDSGIFENKYLKKYKKTSSYIRLVDSLLKLNNEKAYNSDYQIAIDSLTYIDQSVLRGNFHDTTGFNLRTDEDWENLESSNFLKLISYIDKYGYPSERLVGKERYEMAYIILLHNIRLQKNRSYIQLIEHALFEGNCMPEEYGWLIDQTLTEDSKPRKFCLYEANPYKETKKKQAEINNDRFQYGIKPIEAYKCYKFFNILITAKKW